MNFPARPTNFLDLPKKMGFPNLEQASAGLGDCVRALASGLPDLRAVDVANLDVAHAVRVQVGSRFFFRHARRDDLQLSFIRLIRMASANNAALTLVSAGCVHDARVLWRMINEDYVDIVSILGPLREGSDRREEQKGVIPIQEEFDDPVQLTSSSHRPHTGGTAATPDIAEAVLSQANSLFRSLLAVQLVARRARHADVVERACGLAAELARSTGGSNAEGSAEGVEDQRGSDNG